MKLFLSERFIDCLWFRVLSMLCRSVLLMKCLISIATIQSGNPLLISVCFILLSSLRKIVREEDSK